MFEEQSAVCRLVVIVVFVSMYSCCFLCWNTSRPGRQIACSLALGWLWGICSRNITPEPMMSRTFEKSKLAVNRKRSAVDCSLFEARGPKLAAVCSKVCVWFFRTYVFVLLLVLEHFSPRKADCVLPCPRLAMGHLFQEHYPRANDESYL